MTNGFHEELAETVPLKRKQIPENPKIVEFSKIPEIPRGILNATEIFRYAIFENLDKTREDILFSKILLKKAFPFDRRNFQKFKLEFLVEWKAPL